MKRQLELHHGKSGAVISVRVSPRSSKAGIAGILDDGTIKIRLASAPVDGKANEELLGLLAKTLGVQKANLEIISGQTGKSKLVAIYGLDADSVNSMLVQAVKH